MSIRNSIIWNDEEAEKLFADMEFAQFADFSDLEKGELKAKIKSMRRHIDKVTGEVTRQMTRIKVGENIYYLKQACKDAFKNIVNEFNAIEVLSEFDLIPPEIAAFSLDVEKKEGFLLLKDLKGRYSIQELINSTAPQVAIDDFLQRKEDILERIAQKIRKVHKKGYAYPDWFAKHIYIKQGSDEIVLIDLERFRPLNKCPWYFGFPITSIFVKNKFWRKLRRSLKSEHLPDKLLKKLLHE